MTTVPATDFEALPQGPAQAAGLSELAALRSRLPASETEWREIERRLAELEQRS